MHVSLGGAQCSIFASLQGGSPVPPNVRPGQAAGTLLSHSEDVACVLRILPSEAVVVGHSFGGLMLQKYLALSCKDSTSFPSIRGAVFAASGAPNGVNVGRFIQRTPLLALKVSDPCGS